MLTIPNLEIVRWRNQEYIVPLDQLASEDRAIIKSRGQSAVQKSGFWTRIMKVIFDEREYATGRDDELAFAAGIRVFTFEEYEAFRNFKKTIRENFSVFIPLVTDPDIMEREITNEAYAQTDIALSFLFKYFFETASPRSREEDALAEEVEHLAETVADDILTQSEYRNELYKRIQDTRTAISSIRYAERGNLPKDVNVDELLRTSDQALEAYVYEYEALINATRDQLMKVKQACLNFNKELSAHQERRYLRGEVQMLEDLTQTHQKHWGSP